MPKITTLRTIRLPERPKLVWVEIETDDGLTGLGETFRGAQAVEAVLHETVVKVKGVGVGVTAGRGIGYATCADRDCSRQAAGFCKGAGDATVSRVVSICAAIHPMPAVTRPRRPSSLSSIRCRGYW